MEGGVYGSCQKSDTKLEGADCQAGIACVAKRQRLLTINKMQDAHQPQLLCKV